MADQIKQASPRPLDSQGLTAAACGLKFGYTRVFEHMKNYAIAILFAAFTAQSTFAQAWGDLDGLLVRTLSPTGEMVASVWFPDGATPETSQRALGVVYAHVPGSAGTVSIHTGIFTGGQTNWTLVRQVDGLFGQSPQNPVWHADRIEVTTSVLKEGEPRCCPTGVARWSIDVATGQVNRLP